MLRVLFTIFCLKGLLSVCDVITTQKLKVSLLYFLYLQDIIAYANQRMNCLVTIQGIQKSAPRGDAINPAQEQDCRQSFEAPAPVTFKVYKSLVRYVPCSADGRLVSSLHALERAQVHRNERNDC